MAKRRGTRKKRAGAAFRTIDLGRFWNWPGRQVRGRFWKDLAAHVGEYARGRQVAWGIPFRMSGGRRRVILAARGRPDATVPLSGQADFICLLHEWRQVPGTLRREDPTEGLVVAEYELAYADGAACVLPVRGRFEVAMAESPGPAWLAVPFNMWHAVDPVEYPGTFEWGRAQTGTTGTRGAPLVCAMPNPHPRRRLRSLTIRGRLTSPLLVAGVTLCRSSAHPLRHLPRRACRVVAGRRPADVEAAEVDLGGVVRIERTTGPRGRTWLDAPHAGVVRAPEPAAGAEDVIHAFGAEDATLSVKLAGRRGRLTFPLGEAFRRGRAAAAAGKRARLEVLDRRRQWMQVVVRDGATGRPTPVRIHLSGARGEYIAPYGHHARINPGWFMDYGADVRVGGRNYAYVDGEFTTDLPVGDLYVEICKGYEYAPVRRKVTVRPGQKVLELRIDRAADWRRRGWVAADTHVHFLSPHTAALQARGEGVNVVNLLASQWGRLFTNVGDLRGRVNLVEDDTLVYVGTENRNHMLGHMSMLGTQGLPVYPMCCGGPTEAWLGDPDFLAMAEWARENRRKGGVVIRPHYPFCGDTEDPVPILAGLVDALEIRELRGEDFPTQEWYRYLNCGYRVAVCGGTDKMSASCALGWLRTYALTDPDRPLEYAAWASAVRAGRCFSSSGPLIDMTADGRRVGDTIEMPAGGGTVEVAADAECVWPLGRLEIVHDGRVVADARPARGGRRLRVAARVPVRRSGWLAARCPGHDAHPAGPDVAAHTSPVYLRVGRTRAFDGPAAEHMLALVEGGIEYLRTLSTAFDEPSRRRMVRLFQDAQADLNDRLAAEAAHVPHHGQGPYHTHGHGETPDHRHD